MNHITKFLPTEEMRSDFERFKQMTPAEREQFQEERAKKIETMTASEKETFFAATRKGLLATKETLQEMNLALELGDVAKAISLSYIAKTYFGKSKAWLYQRLNAHTVNGKPAQFTEEERKRFAEALHDLSRRIEDAAVKFA